LTAIDTNVLVYAHRAELPQHRAARKRLEALAAGDALWAIPVFCVGELVRVITHPKLFENPFTAPEARTAVERLLDAPGLRILRPGERYARLFLEAVEEANAVGNLVFDAQIVALCRESGVRALLTEDRDFSRFPGFATERL
jgi:hypothetical protein